MVLTHTEQKYLLLMLKNKNEFPDNYKARRQSHFYNTMAKLKKKDLIETVATWNNRSRRRYKLTVYGICRASLIAKDFDSDERFKKFAKEIEMYIVG